MPPLVLGLLRRPGVSWRRIVISGRALVPWLAPLVLAGCPQLMDDEFEVGTASQPGSLGGAAGSSSSSAAGSSGSAGSSSGSGGPQAGGAGGGSGGTGSASSSSSQGGTGTVAVTIEPSCTDGVMNGEELGVDCGADCEPCGCDGTFQEPELLTGFGLEPKLWGPMPARDDHTLYFSQQDDAGVENVYQATRSDRGSVFAAATQLTIVNSNQAPDGTPFITPDGLSFFLFSSRTGSRDRDIWMSTRQSATADFSSPVLVQGVNSDALDQLPWLAPDGLGLYFMSTREGGQGASDIWLAKRATLTDQWSTVVNVSELNTSQRDEGITLSRDGLTAIFASNRDDGEDVDLWLALRSSLDSPFSEPVNLSEVNSSDNDVDPHLSNDGHELFFSSSRSGSQLLWHAWRDCP
jgi:WD40 repeat protein